MLKPIIIFIFLTLTCTMLSAQVTYKSLIGDWTIANADSSYYKQDTVELHQDVTYNDQTNYCDYITWRIGDKKNLVMENLFRCTEPGRIKRAAEKETFRLKGIGAEQIIEIKRGGKMVDRFHVLDLKELKIDKYPYDVKVLTLKRMKLIELSYECVISKTELEELEKRNKYQIKTVIEFKTNVVHSERTITLSGVIHDRRTGLPIAALINIVGRQLSGTANEKGDFSIQIPNEKFKFEVICAGYDRYVSKRLEPQGDAQLNICLGTTVIK